MSKKPENKYSDPLIKVDPSLNGKYDNDPFVLAKVQKAREIIQKYGLPKEFTEKTDRENTK